MKIVICCEEMLEAISEGYIKLDTSHWPRIGSEDVGLELISCPWCGQVMPFAELERVEMEVKA